jgi:hypothetical protein
MDKEGASRSLFAFSGSVPFSESRPYQEYMTYLEVPSVSHENGTRSFGFLNCVRVDPETGIEYIVERPLLAHSNTVIKNAKSAGTDLESLFASEGLSLRNHDMWHQLLQAFAEHFQIHHHTAPLTTAGYMEPYYEFGKNMRQVKDAYEMGVTIGHRQALKELREKHPKFGKLEEDCFNLSFDATREAYDKLSAQGKHKEAHNLVNYMALNVLSRTTGNQGRDTPLRESFARKIDSLAITPRKVDLAELIALLDSQGVTSITQDEKKEAVAWVLDQPASKHLKSNPYVKAFLDSEKSDRKWSKKLNAAFYNILSELPHERLTQLYAKYDKEKAASELGGSELVEVIRKLGVMKNPEEFPVTLHGSDAIRFELIVSESQPALSGLIEKQHHIDKVPFGADNKSPYEIILEQQKALDENKETYRDRVVYRWMSDIASHELLGLMAISHSTEINPTPQIIAQLLENSESSESAKKFLSTIDALSDAVIRGLPRSPSHDEVQSISQIKEVLNNSGIISDNLAKTAVHRIDTAMQSLENLTKLHNTIHIGEVSKSAKPGKPIIIASNQVFPASSPLKNLTIKAIQPNTLKYTVSKALGDTGGRSL